MADNVIADPGAGGATFATDDIAGVHYPRSKVVWGPDGTANDTDNASGKRLPVNIAETIAIPVTDNSGSLTVDGTVAVTHTGLTELAAAINASSQMDVNIAASGATVPVSNAGLTELAAAINASSQMDVNIAASGATLTVASHEVTNAGVFAVQASEAGTWTVQPGNTANTTPWLVSLHDGTTKASVADLTNSNPLHVALVDATGDQITSFGGGTQYTEDAAAAANPVGTAMILVREDARAGALTTADGDNVAARGTNAGELYVKHVDAIPVTDNGGALTVDGTVAVTHAALTELEAAINASSQLDVNIAASGATLTVASHAVTNAGTFAVQAAQSGTWTVQPGNTANTTPWLASIHDGTTKASVADLTNSNPLHVAIVDGAGTQVTSFGGGTQYAEDSIHASGDLGTMALVVRQNSQVDLGADGDYVPMTVDDAGGLRVSIVAGAGSGGTAAADDADFTAGTTQGTPAMGVYESAPTSVTDGDLGTVGITQTRALRVAPEGTLAVSNAGLTELAAAINASSQLDVNIAASAATLTVASHAVTNAGTFAVQESGAALTALQVIDNPVVVDDAAFTPATTSVMMAGFEFDDATPDSVNEGDAGAARMSANRNIYMNIRDAAGNERGANVNASSQLSVSVDNTVTVGSHAVTNAGTFAVQVDGAALTALQVIDNPVLVDDAAFTPATSSVMMAGAEFDDVAVDSVDEGDAGALRMSANRNLYVRIRDNAGNERGLNVDANGALAATVTNATAANLNATVVAAGDIAHDAADSGNPLKVGAKATNAISGVTAVANNDRTQLYAGLDGVLLVRDNANLESLSRGTAAITDGSSTSVIGAAGSGVKTYITDVIISNSSATYVTVDIRDGTAGSVMATFPAPATSGCVHKLGSPIGGTANTAVAADPSASATTVTVTLLGFKSAI